MLQARSLRSVRVCSRGKPEYRAKAVPARGFAVRSRAASGPRSSGTTTGPRGARCTGAGEGPPVRTRRFQETRPGVEPSGNSLGERRSGAPGGVAHRSQGARRASHARFLQFAPFGAPLLSFFGGENETKLGCWCAARTPLLSAHDLTLLNAAASIRHQEEAPESMGKKARS